MPGFEPSANDLRHDEIAQDIDRDNFYGHSSDYDKVKQDMFTARIYHTFSSRVSLENTTRYVKTDRKAIHTVIGSANTAYEVNKNLTLRLSIDNIADKTYAVSTNWSARRVHLGAPRTFMLCADLAF